MPTHKLQTQKDFDISVAPAPATCTFSIQVSSVSFRLSSQEIPTVEGDTRASNHRQKLGDAPSQEKHLHPMWFSSTRMLKGVIKICRPRHNQG